MATTDARTGFRLPWSSDQRQISDGDELTESTDVGATFDSATDAVGQPAAEPSGSSTDEAPHDAGHAASAPSARTVERAPAQPASLNRRKPSKFLADLTKAMQAAAELARGEALSRLQTDAKAYVEQIHARSAEEAGDLRKAADEDVAGIRDWSKAEIARVREETEQRITDRKGRLEREVEQHAALIEAQIDRVQRHVAAFEGEMDVFFERLLHEDDPTRFAAMAENLPEPPSFDALPADWLDGVQPAVETESAAPEAITTTGTDVVEPSAPASDDATWAGTNWDPDTAPPAELTAADQESAFAAIQAAAEEAAVREAGEAAPEADPVVDDTQHGEAVEQAVATTASDTEADADAETAESDPRLSALGLAPDFAAAAEAEAMAAVDAGAETEEIPTIADDALAARLAHLVPNAEGEETELQHTQVVVVGLISVASIAGFKRHLGRLTGVRSVGVSSGPDGEFVFAVTHGPEVVLGDAIPTLPGFGARVTANADGIVSVTARDPESES